MKIQYGCDSCGRYFNNKECLSRIEYIGVTKYYLNSGSFTGKKKADLCPECMAIAIKSIFPETDFSLRPK